MEIYEFNDQQLDRVSEFLANFSLLVIAILVLPNIFGGNKPKIDDLILGLFIAIMLLLGSLVLIRRLHE